MLRNGPKSARCLPTYPCAQIAGHYPPHNHKPTSGLRRPTGFPGMQGSRTSDGCKWRRPAPYLPKSRDRPAREKRSPRAGHPEGMRNSESRRRFPVQLKLRDKSARAADLPTFGIPLLRSNNRESAARLTSRWAESSWPRGRQADGVAADESSSFRSLRSCRLISSASSSSADQPWACARDASSNS